MTSAVIELHVMDPDRDYVWLRAGLHEWVIAFLGRICGADAPSDLREEVMSGRFGFSTQSGGIRADVR